MIFLTDTYTCVGCALLFLYYPKVTEVLQPLRQPVKVKVLYHTHTNVIKFTVGQQ